MMRICVQVLGSMGVHDVVTSLETLLHEFNDQIAGFVDPLLHHLVRAHAGACALRLV